MVTLREFYLGSTSTAVTTASWHLVWRRIITMRTSFMWNVIYKSTVANLATVRNVDVWFDKFNDVRTRWMIIWLDFDSGRGLGIFLFDTASIPALEPTQPPIQRLPAALSLVVKRPGCESDHSPLSSAEVKSAWSYTSTPSVRLHSVVLT
jgi:hypothetical protein